MRWNELAEQECSLARTLAVIGDRWTLLVLREAFLRVRRFEDFQQNLGIARRVLSERLAHLTAEGVLEKHPYQDKPLREEYRLTAKGLDLYPSLMALIHWGDKHCAGPDGPPVLHRHKTCGHDFRSVASCSECGEVLDPREVEPRLNRAG
jgi:DNA-binding HxlR family transcriptional regulator